MLNVSSVGSEFKFYDQNCSNQMRSYIDLLFIRLLVMLLWQGEIKGPSGSDNVIV